METRVLALAAVVILVGIVAVAGRLRRRLAADRALQGAIRPRSEPYILYFTGENCSICHTHQEPALSRLEGVRIEKVDAIEERELAERYHVMTLPTTVVIDADGRARNVNYGYAPAPKLRSQLAEASKLTLLRQTG